MECKLPNPSDHYAALAKEAVDYMIPHQQVHASDIPRSKDLAETLLSVHGGLVRDEHGEKTPQRFVNMLDELTKCREDLMTIDHLVDCIKWSQFENDGMDEMIAMANIPFVSVCNHHIVPFVGKAHIAYVPDKLICGLSKLARVTQHFARRLQVQERMTRQIADFLSELLAPRGLAVMLQAEHMCMTIRGVQTPGTITTTSDMRGVYSDHTRTAKAEFLQIIGVSK